MKRPVAGEISLPEGNAVVFMLVERSASIGEVRLSACRRIGSISTAEGPYLMDAQACRIDRPGRVLIGTSAGAAAFTLPNAKGETLIILDVAFLAQKYQITGASRRERHFRQRMNFLRAGRTLQAWPRTTAR